MYLTRDHVNSATAKDFKKANIGQSVLPTYHPPSTHSPFNLIFFSPHFLYQSVYLSPSHNPQQEGSVSCDGGW